MEHLLISVRTKNKVFGICFVCGKDNYFGLAELGPFLSTSQSSLILEMFLERYIYSFKMGKREKSL